MHCTGFVRCMAALYVRRKMQSDLSSHSQVQFEADRAEKAEKALALKSTVSLKHDDGGHSPILNRI